MKISSLFSKYDLVLASQSPRRRSLLEQVGLIVTVIPSGVDEASWQPLDSDTPETLVQALAVAKALDVGAIRPGSWVIGADTVVVIDGEVLGKPGSANEARSMLKRLSGRTHTVLTGYCIHCQASNRHIVDVVSTLVTMRELSKHCVDWYIGTGEPFDKAGAYAAQGIGAALVRRIEGSYTNVVGLPVCEVVEHLVREGIVCLAAH